VVAARIGRVSQNPLFNAWQNAEYMANLFVIAGVAVYLWRVANPPDPTRFVRTAKFRG